MKKRVTIILALILIHCAWASAAEKAEVERGLKEKPLSILAKKELFLSSYYEYGWVKLKPRKGQWRLFTNTIGYSFENGLVPYLEVDSWDRFHDKDQMISLGAYLKFEDSSYLRSEIGFGDDITYLPTFRTVQEYEHRMAKNLFWQFGYKHLNYSDNDVDIVYPGLIYYFDDHYLSAFYNASFTQSRGTAHWGTVKGNFTLSERVSLWLGTAVGERLYDIELLKASKEYGYIIFSGADFKIYKGLAFRLGFSYSREKPSFIKRSIDYGMSLKF